MANKTKYIGCCTYFDNSRLIDMIDWSNEDEIIVYHQVDYLNADGYEENDYEDKNNLTYCEYLDISNSLFEILVNSIENKPIKSMTYNGPTFSSISTFISKKDNVIYELIVDEKHLIYVINSFENENDSAVEYPFNIFNKFIKGLDAAGYHKIDIDYRRIK